MQKLKLSFNWFFVCAAISSYLFGVVIAHAGGEKFNLFPFVAGLLIFLGFYLLQLLQRHLTSNKLNLFTRINTSAQSQPAPALSVMVTAFFAVFVGLYLLLKAEVLIGTNFLLVMSLALVMVVSFGRFSRQWFDGLSWFFEGLIVSPLMFLLGCSIQEYRLSYLLLVLWIPIFAMYSSAAITLLFSEYDQNRNVRTEGFIAKVGWEKALRFHHALLGLAYVSLTAYLFLSGSWAANWPVLALLVVSGLEVYLLERMAAGMKPNWLFLKTLAIVQFFSLIYLLAYPLLIN